MAALFSRIIPILFVGDLEAERDFYLALGFHVTYEGPEYPYFLALGQGKIEFGIEWRRDFSAAAPDRVLTWQFGVSDLDSVKNS
jgi:catechol 2,3-dioxygenase-like lactoylglutathione lyase family enzyme